MRVTTWKNSANACTDTTVSNSTRLSSKVRTVSCLFLSAVSIAYTNRLVSIVTLSTLALGPVVQFFPAHAADVEDSGACFEPCERPPLLARHAPALGNPAQARDRFAVLARGPLQNDGVESASRGLLAHLSLLFIPAGVGVVQKLDLLAEHGIAILAILVGSVVITLLVTVATFLLASRLLARRQQKP